MKNMKYLAVVFVCLCLVLCACALDKGDGGETQKEPAKEESVETRQEPSKVEAAVEADFPNAEKATGQVLVLNEDSMIVQMHYPGAKMGVLETRTIGLDDSILQKEFAEGEFIKILFDGESNQSDAPSSPGLGSGVVDNKTDLDQVYMICSVLQPRKSNPEVDLKALRKVRKSNLIEGIVTDVTDDFIEATIGTGKKGSVRLYFKEDTCGFIQPCFIGDKVSYCYFYDSVKPVGEEDSSVDWVEACLLSTDYGNYLGEVLGYNIE